MVNGGKEQLCINLAIKLRQLAKQGGEKTITRGLVTGASQERTQRWQLRIHRKREDAHTLLLSCALYQLETLDVIGVTRH